MDTAGGRVADPGGIAVTKPKVPFRHYPLPRPRGQEWTPPKDKAEGVTASEKGYWPGWNFSDAEKEFMTAVVRWQRKHRSKFLSHSAYLRIALELGYRRVFPPAPPTPAAHMNADTILKQMLSVGFTFSFGPDGVVTFHPPADVNTDEKQNLLGVVAWSWSWLAEHAAKYVTNTPEVRQ